MNSKNLKLVKVVNDVDILTLDPTKRKDANLLIRYKQTVINYIIDNNNLTAADADNDDIRDDFFYFFVMEAIDPAKLINSKFWICEKSDILAIKGESLKEFMHDPDMYIFENNTIGLSESDTNTFISVTKEVPQLDLMLIFSIYERKTDKIMSYIECIAHDSESYTRTKYDLLGWSDEIIVNKKSILDKKIKEKKDVKKSAETKLRAIFGYGYENLLTEETKKLLEIVWED